MTTDKQMDVRKGHPRYQTLNRKYPSESWTECGLGD